MRDIPQAPPRDRELDMLNKSLSSLQAVQQSVYVRLEGLRERLFGSQPKDPINNTGKVDAIPSGLLPEIQNQLRICHEMIVSITQVTDQLERI